MADHLSPTFPQRPLRILLLVAAPLMMNTSNGLRPVTPLAVQAEIDALREVCEALDPPVAVEMQVEFATTKTLDRLIATVAEPFDILHFTGHGMLERDAGALVIEDETGIAHILSAQELAERLTPRQQPLCNLAVLSACHSAALAHVLIDTGVLHVVAINASDEVLDTAARQFATTFYQGLIRDHNTVAQAFQFAQTSAKWSISKQLGDHNAPTFALLPEDYRLDLQPFVRRPPAGPVAITPRELVKDAGLITNDPFVGRVIEIHDLNCKLKEHQCVVLYGPGGMGKTSLAQAVGRWQAERRLWRKGVHWIALRNVTTAAEARARITLALGLEAEVAKDDRNLAAAVRDDQRLLILDDLDLLLRNDSHATADLLRTLLTCRRLRLLITTRDPLPSTVSHLAVTLQRLEPEDAGRAFLSHAPNWAKHQDGTADDWQAVLRFLDGYPFPIRLAATHLEQTRCGLPLLLQRLHANPQGTLRYAGHAEDRETSLAATLDLSFQVLPVAAQKIFPLLAMFPAGLTREAARAILGPDSERALETLLRYSMAEYRDTAAINVSPCPNPPATTPPLTNLTTYGRSMDLGRYSSPMP